MLREDFDAAFIVMFGLLLFLKCFHWIAADRVEWVRLVPHVAGIGTPLLRTRSLES